MAVQLALALCAISMIEDRNAFFTSLSFDIGNNFCRLYRKVPRFLLSHLASSCRAWFETTMDSELWSGNSGFWTHAHDIRGPRRLTDCLGGRSMLPASWDGLEHLGQILRTSNVATCLEPHHTICFPHFEIKDLILISEAQSPPLPLLNESIKRVAPPRTNLLLLWVKEHRRRDDSLIGHIALIQLSAIANPKGDRRLWKL
jgi:hypothetical protein